MCTGEKGKQTNKQVEAAHVEAQMQGAVQSCVTCRVQYTMHQSTWKSFRDALEMHQKSAESDTQGHTLTQARAHHLQLSRAPCASSVQCRPPISRNHPSDCGSCKNHCWRRCHKRRGGCW